MGLYDALQTFFVFAVAAIGVGVEFLDQRFIGSRTSSAVAEASRSRISSARFWPVDTRRPFTVSPETAGMGHDFQRVFNCQRPGHRVARPATMLAGGPWLRPCGIFDIFRTHAFEEVIAHIILPDMLAAKCRFPASRGPIGAGCGAARHNRANRNAAYGRPRFRGGVRRGSCQNIWTLNSSSQCASAGRQSQRKE